MYIRKRKKEDILDFIGAVVILTVIFGSLVYIACKMY